MFELYLELEGSRCACKAGQNGTLTSVEVTSTDSTSVELEEELPLAAIRKDL